MVNRFGELSSDFTPAAEVTFCSTMVPATGARISISGETCLRVASQKPYALLGGLHVDVRLIRGVLGDLQFLLRHRPVGIQKLDAVQLALRQRRVGLEFLIVGESLRHVRAGHGQQKLPLLHIVAQARFDIHDATRERAFTA